MRSFGRFDAGAGAGAHAVDAAEDNELLLDALLAQDDDAFAMSLPPSALESSLPVPDTPRADGLLLDFDPDGALLTPAELDAAMQEAPATEGAQTQQRFGLQCDWQHGMDKASWQTDPSSPAATDVTDMSSEAATPPPPQADIFDEQSPFGAASSPPARPSLLDAASSTSTHSPLPKRQKQLAAKKKGDVDANAALPATKKLVGSAPVSAAAFSGVLPYAMPVAYFPPLATTHKRPFAQMLPSAPTSATDSTAASTSAAATSVMRDTSSAAASATASTTVNKSKREIRQMKNRESANKSRQRRKAQLSNLSVEVEKLTKKQQELQTIIAGLRAENKSLHDQNSFLRSLVTDVKQEPRAGGSHAVGPCSPLPAMENNTIALSVLESGQQMQMDKFGDIPTKGGDSDADEAVDIELSAFPTPTSTSKRRRLAASSTLSTCSLAVCASVFGITMFADYESGVVDSANIRGTGRVLHEAPTSVLGVDGCSTEGPLSLMELVLAGVGSWWKFVSSSELVFGVLLNVLSFLAILGLYQLWQSRSETFAPWKQAWSSTPRRRARPRRRAHLLVNGTAASAMTTVEGKRRSSSWQDVHARDGMSLHGESGA